MTFDTERKWAAFGPLIFTQDGTSNGIITVVNTYKFRVGQMILIKATGEADLSLKVKRVLSTSKIAVGQIDKNIHHRVDLSLYTVLKSSSVLIPEQDKPKIPKDDRESAMYEQDPLFALRTVDVDEYGQIRTPANPYPVSVVSEGTTTNDRIKNDILCAPDVIRDLTWAEIDGVRRVIQIDFTSNQSNVLYNGIYTVTRVFTYDTIAPFDLDKIIDTLVVV